MNEERRTLAAFRLATSPDVQARLLANEPVAIAELDQGWARKYRIICARFACTERPRGDSDMCPQHWYQDYLDSPHWKTTRTAKLQQSGKRCERCGTSQRLEVHHRTYERVGSEHLDDLEVLCADCHEKHHKENG